MGVPRPPSVMFVQGNDPALYPPTLHASSMMADAGWNVTILSLPQDETGIAIPAHHLIHEVRMRPRKSFQVGALQYASYCRAAVGTALRCRPDIVYASDPLGAAPGLLAANAVGSRLVYHEHDTPSDSSGRELVRRARRAVANRADIVVFPNEKRAQLVQSKLGFSSASLRIVWNTPSLKSLPTVAQKCEGPIIVYFHGSITKERLPTTVPEAIARLNGAAMLRIAGYEAPSGKGYVDELEKRWGRFERGGLVDWIGPFEHHPGLLSQAAQAHIGLALMPMETEDINLKHMVGASNKAFDYMAAELALVVSDLDGWRSMFVDAGYAIPCDPRDTNSVEAALRRLVENPMVRTTMAQKSRAKIELDWNYEKLFGPVLAEIGSICKRKV